MDCADRCGRPSRCVIEDVAAPQRVPNAASGSRGSIKLYVQNPLPVHVMPPVVHSNANEYGSPKVTMQLIGMPM
jgi:hypothetical protein